MAAIRPHPHVLFFVVVTWAASIIVCKPPSTDVVVLLLCFALEHLFEIIVSILKILFDGIYGRL